jgi:hypothetical protein
MNDENILNTRIETEFKNPVYNTITQAIIYTAKKQHYKKYDFFKLIMTIYNKDYSFISNDQSYREQFKLLDEYFYEQYHHSIITFEMIKTILKYQGTKTYDELTKDIATLETMLRTNKNQPAEDLCIFSSSITNKNYNNLMMSIEANWSMKYAVAIIYDKINITVK